ncbi:hypothetical protein V6N12_045292 [Hibiscus sabdariffa]|uniref:Reverse transcriptase zinc-binding domain-containing protein n=1 Tax=Hibiscus sabdariffa TaxID=183260 RepID=A0ABR2G2I9_9ROSI
MFSPPKVQTFEWHAGHDALPTDELFHKAEMGDGFCRFCPGVVETLSHTLRDCLDTTKALGLAGLCEWQLTIDGNPLDSYTKINSDGAYNQTSKSVGLGVVARDCCGLVLGGLAQPH